MKFYSFIFILGLFSICVSCVREEALPPEQVIPATATEEDFNEESQVSPILAEGFEMKLWAPGPLLSNAVALTFDGHGIAYVAETSRRKSSDLDIRQHRDWMTEDLSLTSIEETRDFHLKKLATSLSDENEWLTDHNEDGIRDYRDLSVQSEYIRRVWDSDGDGRADKSQLFAEGINDMLTGVAAGILSFNDEIYVTAAPDVFRLKDTNADGIADERAEISHGYGIHIAFAGHDMSGLTIGHDGKIYWSIGDMGVNVVGQDGKRWKYPHEGAVMRSNPDGSEFEVFAHGLRNPQELAFDNYGNLISVDNDGDHQGEHERYVHIIEGSDTGWRIHWQFGKYNLPNESYKVWMDEKLSIPHFPGQAAYLLPPLALAYNGPAGLAFNPGTALGKEWNNHFFASYFTASSARSKIQSFQLVPRGGSFAIKDIKDIVGGIVPTGITFAADGALYINDWKDSYDKKPAGRIWKLDVTEDLKNKNRTSTQNLLKTGLKGMTAQDLAALLEHEDKRVRLASQFELVKLADLSTLLRVVTKSNNLFAQLHAIWGIGQLGRKNSDLMVELLFLLSHENEHVRAQTAKVMGEAKFQPSSDKLINQTKDQNGSARFFAVEALGKLGDKKAFQALVDVLADVEDSDPHMRHAASYALARLGQEESLAELSEHPSMYVRLGAVVALREILSPSVSKFLSDDEPLVVIEAARAINDDESIPLALESLANILNTTGIEDEALIRRAINANLRIANKESTERLGAFVLKDAAPLEMRKDALWALGYWKEPLKLDRVDGSYRELNGHVLSDAQAQIALLFPALINKPNEELKAAIITAAGRLNCVNESANIYDLFKAPTNESLVRHASLGALASMKSDQLAPALELALVDVDKSLREKAQDYLSEIKLSDTILLGMLEKILDNNTISEQQKALASLANVKLSGAEAVLNKWMGKLEGKTLAPELELDLLNAIEKTSFEGIKKRKLAYEESLNSSDPISKYNMTMSGGDSQRGFRIFTRNETAQCLRCHEYKGYGGDVGPGLTNIASTLSKVELLQSLIDPNTRLAPGFGTVFVTLTDGKELSGILMEENSESITIKSGDNPVQTLKRSSIKEIQNLPSGMFDMSTILEKDQIRDLMAFLVTLK